MILIATSIATATITGWTIFGSEYLATRLMPYSSPVNPLFVQLGGPMILGLILLVRLRSLDTDNQRRHTLIQLGVVCAAAIILVSIRPSQIGAQVLRLPALISARGISTQALDALKGKAPGPEYLDTTWLDPLASLAYGSVGITLLLALALSLPGLRSRAGAEAHAIAILLLLSTLLLNLFASATIVGLLGIGQAATSTIASSVMYLQSRHMLGGYPYEATLWVMQTRASSQTSWVMLPLAALLSIIALTVITVAIGCRGQLGALLRDRKALLIRRSLRIFDITGLWVVISSVVAIALITLGVDAVATNKDTFGGEIIRPYGDGTTFAISAHYPVLFTAIDWTSAALAALIFTMIRRSRWDYGLGNALSRFSDVIGFWPISISPLGGRSYRDETTAEIVTAVNEFSDQRVVVAGHSQGSVLAAWSIVHGKIDASRGQISLVTCGSPLKSLYARFFPEHFDSEFFERLGGLASRDKSSGWANFWRTSDPISDEAKSLGAEDHLLADPPAWEPGVLQVHSDYWLEPEQEDRVEAWLSGATVEPEGAEAAEDLMAQSDPL